MIIVAGGSVAVEPSMLTASERDIYIQKNASPVQYHYESLDSLRFELRLRESIVRAAIALDQTPARFASFRNSRCNPSYWIRTMNGGFQQRSNVRPTDAIRDIYKNGALYAFECATAIVIVLYKGVLDTIGPASFDRLFSNLILFAWQHDSDLRLVTEYNKTDAYPGDVQYFKNPDVDPKTPQWQGENVIRLHGRQYYGHGIGVGYADKMIAKLNRHRIPGSKISAYLLAEVTYPNFFYIQRAASGQILPSEPFPMMPMFAAERDIVARIGSRTGLYR